MELHCVVTKVERAALGRRRAITTGFGAGGCAALARAVRSLSRLAPWHGAGIQTDYLPG
jgi:dienelactone hydrolase